MRLSSFMLYIQGVKSKQF